jgi:DNA-binding NtrC family response regulator
MVVEDDGDIRRSLTRYLEREGCVVTAVEDGQVAIEKLAGGLRPDLIISDLAMPRADGRQVLAEATRHRIPLVILTAQGTVQAAVELMRSGAANFLTKPFTPESLAAVLDDAFGRAERPQPKERRVIGGAQLQHLLTTVQSVADTDATVLITGESGTGKELVARLLHEASLRALGPFVAVNCGAIPEALLESELFGHAKGAFTGATQSRAGRFALAERGTLFLDEIGDVPLAAQVKLLRVLQERTFEVLGESTPRKSNVRVIAATHRDLAKMAADGRYREDLYYRLNVVGIHLPALRERSEDIPLLAEHFRLAANERHGRSVAGIAADAMATLQAHAWPGNIRELANVIERMVIMKRTGTLTVADLPAGLGAARKGPADPHILPESGLDLRQTVSELEGSLIDQALQRTGGNKNAAAQLLGLNRTTLVEKLRRMRPGG